MTQALALQRLPGGDSPTYATLRIPFGEGSYPRLGPPAGPRRDARCAPCSRPVRASVAPRATPRYNVCSVLQASSMFIYSRLGFPVYFKPSAYSCTQGPAYSRILRARYTRRYSSHRCIGLFTSSPCRYSMYSSLLNHRYIHLFTSNPRGIYLKLGVLVVIPGSVYPCTQGLVYSSCSISLYSYTQISSLERFYEIDADVVVFLNPSVYSSVYFKPSSI